MTHWRKLPDNSEWTIDLPIVLKSANAHIVNGRHAATAALYRRARNSVVGMLAMTRLGLNRSDVPPLVNSMAYPRTPRREVTFTRLLGKRQRPWDDDNLIAALKHVRDALQVTRPNGRRVIQGAGLIVDDSARWATFPPPKQERSADGKPGLRIMIRDVEAVL